MRTSLPRLRDERHRGSRAARRPRRPQAGPPPDPATRWARWGSPPRAPYRKCAAIVGEVMGKYHPHGDVALYDALVRLAQDFSMRYPLVDGQGNFGSVDGDSRGGDALHRGAPDRDRRRDARRHRQGHRRLRRQLRRHPAASRSVLPAKLPNLLDQRLVAGSRSAWPPTSRRTTSARSSDADDRPHRRSRDHHRTTCAPTSGARTSRPAPPSSATSSRRNPITGEQETVDAIRQMYAHGHGRVVMRAQVAFEEARRDRIAIIVTELPYQVNKASLLEKIADLVKDKKIEGIADLRDESDRDGMRIYIEIKSDANPHKVLNNLFKHTPMQTGLQPEHARPRRRPAPDAAAQVGHRPPRRAPPRDRPAPDRVRPGQGPRPGPHPRGPQDRPRQPRRGHQDDPRVGRRRDRPRAT